MPVYVENYATWCRFFLRDGVKPPLCLGDVLLEDNTMVKGFLGESYAVIGAEDVTHFGGWRAYMASKQ
jgi:allophanate hydrolase